MKKTGLKRPGYRYDAKPAKPVEGFKKAVPPRKAQPGYRLTLQCSKPVPPSGRTSAPPACLDSYGQACPYGIDSGLDTRKMASRTAFHHAAASRTPEAPHEQGVEKSIEKSACKSMPPHLTLVAAGTHRRLWPGELLLKKVYLLEIHVNK